MPDTAKRAIGFVVAFVIFGTVSFFGLDSKSSKNNMVKVLKKSNAIDAETENYASNFQNQEDVQGLITFRDFLYKQADRYEAISVTGCPASFKERYQTVVRIRRDQADLTKQMVLIVQEAQKSDLSPQRQSEIEGLLHEVVGKLVLSDSRCLAAAVQLWDHAKSLGARAELTIPGNHSREELRNMDLSQNLADPNFPLASGTSSSGRAGSSNTSDDDSGAVSFSPPSKPASKPLAKPARSADAGEIQTVYTAMQKRLSALVSRGSDSTVKGEARKTLADKIRDYTTKAVESDLPADFRNLLKKVDQKLSEYAKLQELQIDAENSYFEDKDPDVEVQEEKLLDEIRTLWKEMSDIAEEYGCERGEIGN